MKKLEKNFTKRGFDYDLIERMGDVAIYKLTRNNASHYEVFQVLKSEEREIEGITIPAGERTPSNEQWGTYGYSTGSIERAYELFSNIQTAILQREENRLSNDR